MPAHARTTDPRTSHAAAAKWTEVKISDTKYAICWLFDVYGPMHHEALIERWRECQELDDKAFPNLKDQSIRSRASDLEKDNGLLVSTGRTVTLSNGNESEVWELI